jgi:hypothetical protein
MEGALVPEVSSSECTGGSISISFHEIRTNITSDWRLRDVGSPVQVVICGVPPRSSTPQHLLTRYLLSQSTTTDYYRVVIEMVARMTQNSDCEMASLVVKSHLELRMFFNQAIKVAPTHLDNVKPLK